MKKQIAEFLRNNSSKRETENSIRYTFYYADVEKLKNEFSEYLIEDNRFGNDYDIKKVFFEKAGCLNLKIIYENCCLHASFELESDAEINEKIKDKNDSIKAHRVIEHFKNGKSFDKELMLKIWKDNKTMMKYLTNN